MSQKKIIIMPTINIPSVLTQWAATLTPGQDQIIVAGGGAPGDDKPHQKIESLMIAIEEKFGVQSRYIRPVDQEYWRCSEDMGWYSTTRRNIALLEALKEKPDLIVTLDDDNAPSSIDQLHTIDGLFINSSTSTGVSTSHQWYDPGVLCYARDGWGNEDCMISHRGFPLSKRFAAYGQVITADTSAFPIGVFASLWTGAPDIDAIDRIALDPMVYDVHSGVKVLPGTWAPFDSQATVYRAELAPLMMCWPRVGRYDDIWASYLARAIMDKLNYSVFYGRPSVHQDRNHHDLLNDLEVEMFGMKHNDRVIEVLRSLTFNDDESVMQMLGHAYKVIIDELGEKDMILYPQTIRAFRCWLDDLNEVYAS